MNKRFLWNIYAFQPFVAPQSNYSSNQSNRQNQHSDTHQISLFFKSILLTTALAKICHDNEDSNDAQQKSHPVYSTPLVVKCAEIAKPMSKDRQAAIKALDVVADVAQDVQPAVVSITSTELVY